MSANENIYYEANIMIFQKQIATNKIVNFTKKSDCEKFQRYS